jgi:hypothetical protein
MRAFVPVSPWRWVLLDLHTAFSTDNIDSIFGLIYSTLRLIPRFTVFGFISDTVSAVKAVTAVSDAWARILQHLSL